MESVPNLDEDNWNLWGSVRQLRFGRVVMDTLGGSLDAVFGALLSPTGGIVGPGNDAMFKGNYDDGIVMHGIVHDGGGYLLNYHGVGPGYNYLGTYLTLFPSSSPLSNQVSGISYWTALIKKWTK